MGRQFIELHLTETTKDLEALTRVPSLLSRREAFGTVSSGSSASNGPVEDVLVDRADDTDTSIAGSSPDKRHFNLDASLMARLLVAEKSIMNQKLRRGMSNTMSLRDSVQR